MEWKRTGPISLRCEPYLIIRLIADPPYLALYGPALARTDLGRHMSAEDAKACCEAHNAAEQAKKKPAD